MQREKSYQKPTSQLHKKTVWKSFLHVSIISYNIINTLVYCICCCFPHFDIVSVLDRSVRQITVNRSSLQIRRHHSTKPDCYTPPTSTKGPITSTKSLGSVTDTGQLNDESTKFWRNMYLYNNFLFTWIRTIE